MTKFRNNKSNKNQGIHTIFGQHSVKAALQNDKREHIELIISKNHINFAKASLTFSFLRLVLFINCLERIRFEKKQTVRPFF